MALACWMGVMAQAAVDVAETHDTLVYKDGDRLHGKWVGTKDGIIVFNSKKFGELRVPAAEAVIIKGEDLPKPAAVAAKPAPAVAKPASAPPPAAVATAKPPEAPAVKSGAVAATAAPKTTVVERDAERATVWDRFSPAQLTARVRNYFGPWHGRLSFSTDGVTDTADRDNQALEGTLKRKWKSDEVQLNARYDYNQTNKVVTGDVVRGSGLLRHDFNPKTFAQYRTSGEWNHASRRRGVPNDYILLQQEIGVGYTLLTLPTRKVRLGVSENLFDVWNTKPTPDHFSRVRESIFEEVELTLPWRISVLQRAVWYPVLKSRDGWESRFEVNKKLTETLSTSVRHEIRRYNATDGSAQDYARLKLMFGFDF